MESLHKKRKVWKRPEKGGTAPPDGRDGYLAWFTYFCRTMMSVVLDVGPVLYTVGL